MRTVSVGGARRRRRMRVILTAILAVVLVLGGAVNLPRMGAQDDSEALALALLGKVIVIDAGHGGFDPGAIGAGGVLEKDVNLAISRRVAGLLRQVGAQVVETRTEDIALAAGKSDDIHRRVEIAEEVGADLFITVQANSIADSRWRGAQVFYARGSEVGEGLSKAIQDSLAAVLKNTDRVAKSIDNIYVVNRLSIPSIVVETGFLSNPDEEALLADSDYQQLTAYAIFLGIIAYYADVSVAEF